MDQRAYRTLDLWDMEYPVVSPKKQSGNSYPYLYENEERILFKGQYFQTWST